MLDIFPLMKVGYVYVVRIVKFWQKHNQLQESWAYFVYGSVSCVSFFNIIL